MAQKTRFGLEGYGVRRAGSFAGKTAAVVVVAVTGRGGSSRANLEASRNGDPLLFFLGISGAGLEDTLYIVSDNATRNGVPVTYVYDGNTYTAYPFSLEILTDSDAAPTGKVSITNIDRRIGEIVRQLAGRPELDLAILPASDFDLTVEPRVLLTVARPVYGPVDGLEIRNVKGDAMALAGDIVSVDDAAEPWPAIRATQALLPGLFR